ncbi:hypothetical protein V3C99_018901 [Haemonchus contortus]
MPISWLRNSLYILLVIHTVHLDSTIENCTLNNSCHDRGNLTDHGQSRLRLRRAPPAQCTPSLKDISYTLKDEACCDASIPFLVDNQLSTSDGMGAISRAVQKRVQSRFNRSFEVIISEADFVINTYYSGSRQCKFETDRYYVALYETPTQYDLNNVARENELASVDSRDPLGWKQAPLAVPEDFQDIGIIDSEAGSRASNKVLPGDDFNLKTPIVSVAGSTDGKTGTFRRQATEDSAATCAGRGPNADASRPLTFSANECCDSRLAQIMRSAADDSSSFAHLGDAAKFIQRRIQLEYLLSFEVIISAGDFATSTYYHGTNTCKIRVGQYNVLAYETPVQYNPFDIVEEDFLASADSEEPLGSSRPTNVRGDFPDVRVDPSAGDDLTIQPSPREARARAFLGAGGAGVTSEHDASDIDMVPPGQSAMPLTVIDGFHVGGNRSLGVTTRKDLEDLPPGSHCDKQNRTGDICCSSALFETMTDAFYEMSSSPEFSFSSAGNLASFIQKRVQNRFGLSFEVIVSPGDFALASYGVSDDTCKYHERGFVAMAYATPIQYDITRLEDEEYFSSISSRDDLGATEPYLPEQRPFHTPLALEAGGDRAGFPKGSHCLAAERAGRSKCCSLPLFRVMQSTYESLIKNPNFDPYNTRTIAQAIQYDAEEELQMSFEVLVSTDDFAYASAYAGPMICKFRVDRYYAMAYASPRQYPIHTDFFDDDGLAIPLYCPAEVSVLSGYLCCDGTLQYEMLRSFYDERKNQSGRDIDAEALAKRALNNVQRRFNTTFESIVSPSDFVWRTHVYNQFSCKFVYDGLHALLFESSKAFPPELLSEVAPPAVPAAPPAIGPPQAPFGPPQAPFGPPQAPLGPPQAPFGPPQAPFAPPQAPFGPPQAPVAPPNAPFVAPPAPLASPGVFPVAPPAPVAPPPAAVEPAGFFPGGLEGGFGGGGFGGGGGGGGGGCFSTDTWVTTPDGKKRMDQLKVGDFILTANQTAAYFTPVTLWIHREPEVVTKFVTIMTDYGKMLALTPRHLIFRNKCDEFYSDRVTELPPNSKAVYAEELVVGDCVFLLYRNGFRQQKLQDISITSRKGVFSPLTPNGRILVNDMLASCYSDVMTSLRKRLLSLFGYWIDQSVDLPFGSEFSMELLRLIVPYIK